MKKFFAEFKKFITRGNVLDMAVGVIVGGAFTAIVNGLSNFVLKPIINWVLALILGKDALSELFTFLKTAYLPLLDADGNAVVDTAGNALYSTEIDLANSIYIDWGSLINAIINFLLIALVLFIIVRTINNLKENGTKAKAGKLTKEEKAEMKNAGLNPKNKADVATYRDMQAKKAEEEAAAAEEAAKAEREANPTTEDLLKKILVAIESK